MVPVGDRKEESELGVQTDGTCSCSLEWGLVHLHVFSNNRQLQKAEHFFVLKSSIPMRNVLLYEPGTVT